MTEITVVSDDIKTVVFDGSVVIVTGTSTTGQRVTFAGDLEPMCTLIDEVMRSGEATAEVEDWQTLGRVAA
jgi:hypothetical protein